MAGRPPQFPWLVGLCSVVFDVDVGQTVQHVVPAGALTPDEESAISFNSFPDSLSMELRLKNSIRDSSFSFRVPSCSSTNIGKGSDTDNSKEDPPGTAPPTAAGSRHHLYGYVFCRQRLDESLRRGGEQSSVVVVSRWPLSCVLGPLAQVAGPMYFSKGAGALQQVYDEVCSWPAPVPSSSVSLSVGGTTITARVPNFDLLPPPQPPVDPEVQCRLRRRSSSKAPGRWNSINRQGSIASLSTAASSSSASEQQLASAYSLAAAEASQQQQQQQQQEGDSSQQVPSEAAADPIAPSSTTGGSSTTQTAQGPSSTGGLAAAVGPADVALVPAVATTPGSPSRRAPVMSEAEEYAVTAPHAALPLYPTFKAVLRHLWQLWEIVLLGHPLMVVGPQPLDCSTGVCCLMALIAPLPYSADYRPFWVIHDATFLGIQQYFREQQAAQSRAASPFPAAVAEEEEQEEEEEAPADAGAEGTGDAAAEGAVAAEDAAAGDAEGEQDPEAEAEQEEPEEEEEEEQAEPGSCAAPPAGQQQLWEAGLPVLLGITNLYLLRALPQWKTVLSIGTKETSLGKSGTTTATAGCTRSYFSPSNALRALRRRSQGTNSLLSDYSQALWGAPKALIRPDNRLISSWSTLAGDSSSSSSGSKVAAGGDGPQVASRAIRRHFAELTLAVLEPFKQYLQPAADGMVTRWCPSTFLAEVAAPGAVDPLLQQRLVGGGSAATLTTFYSRLLAGPHWRPWFEGRLAAVAHLARPEPKVVTLSSHGGEDIALVEAFVRLELALQEAAGPSSNSSGRATSEVLAELQLQGPPPGSGSPPGPAGGRSSEGGLRRTSRSAPDLLSDPPLGGSSLPDKEKSKLVIRLEQQLVKAFFAMPLDLQQMLVTTPSRLARLMALVQTEEHHDQLQRLIATLA